MLFRSDGVVIGTTEGTVVTKGVTGGNGLVAGILGWEPEGGSGVVRLGGECYAKDIRQLGSGQYGLINRRCLRRDAMSVEKTRLDFGIA